MEWISKKGYEDLQEELRRLLTEERPRVVSQVADAAAEGDRSENAEYIYGKKRLREIDRRVRFLSRRLDQLKIRAAPQQDERVEFLSWVLLEDEEEEQVGYQIVGSDESAPERGAISYLSPIGKALLGRSVDEEFTVRVPRGEVSYLVLEVRRSPPERSGEDEEA